MDKDEIMQDILVWSVVVWLILCFSSIGALSCIGISFASCVYQYGIGFAFFFSILFVVALIVTMRWKIPEIYNEKSYRFKHKSIESLYPSDWDSIGQKALERDNYTCATCGSYATQVHNIVPLRELNSINNLISLCEDCHKKIHLR